jgi:molybdenum cofactor cytidylyltransferase
LKKGLNHLLEKKPSLDVVIILVCDQPFLSASIVDCLIDEYLKTKNKIVACLYSDVVGVPVLFDSSLFDELLQLPDEQGAKKLIHQYKELATTIDFQEGIIDLDTREDYENFLRSNSL